MIRLFRSWRSNPPDIRELNDSIREESWTNFSLDSVKFPTVAVDAVKGGESLGELIFREISNGSGSVCQGIVGWGEKSLGNF